MKRNGFIVVLALLAFVVGYLAGVFAIARSFRRYDLTSSGAIMLSGSGDILSDSTIRLDVKWKWILPASLSGRGDTIIVTTRDRGWRLVNAESPLALFSLSTIQDAEFYVDVLNQTGIVVAYAQVSPGVDGSATFELQCEEPIDHRVDFTVIHLRSKVLPVSEEPGSRVVRARSLPGSLATSGAQKQIPRFQRSRISSSTHNDALYALI